jgi:protein-S-isoprenylcysteine O-methyltransferase Ste14
MFVLARAITYAALFIGFFLVYLPARILERAGIQVPAATGFPQVVGGLLAALGAALAIACVLTFAIVGKGTPAPFDPPRKLVIRGPYAWVRNPMYVGAWLALAGAALYFQSRDLVLLDIALIVSTVAFVHLYEEPTLRQQFGMEYDGYCARVGRWWPRNPSNIVPSKAARS